MVESLITMSIAGFLTGFIFSMPIAGPISIMITSNALKGRLRYCNLFNLGASLGDFIYVFIAVYGLSKLYSFYKPIIPYIFTFGALLLFFLGFHGRLPHLQKHRLLPGKVCCLICLHSL